MAPFGPIHAAISAQVALLDDFSSLPSFPGPARRSEPSSYPSWGEGAGVAQDRLVQWATVPWALHLQVLQSLMNVDPGSQVFCNIHVWIITCLTSKLKGFVDGITIQLEDCYFLTR